MLLTYKHNSDNMTTTNTIVIAKEVKEMKISELKFEIALANSGLTIGGLAKNAGVSRNRVNVILNQKTVTPRAAGIIARGLGVDVREIIETD